MLNRKLILVFVAILVKRLFGLQEVLSVRPDRDVESVEKDYSLNNVQLGGVSYSSAVKSRLFSYGSSNDWLVIIEKPNVEVVTKAQMVDYYAQILSKVLGKSVPAVIVNNGVCAVMFDMLEGDFEVVAAQSCLRRKVRKLHDIGCTDIEWLEKNKSVIENENLSELQMV